jgi:DNA-binding transcriptional MerR regulator
MEVSMLTTKTNVQTKWLKISSAAKLVGVGRTTLHRAAERGEIVPVLVDGYLGGERLFRVKDLLEWKAAREAREAE